MTHTSLRKLELPASAPEGAQTGCIVGLDPVRGLLVDFEGNTLGPIPARTVVSFTSSTLQEALLQRQEIILLFEGNQPDRPIVVGVLQALPPIPAEPILTLPHVSPETPKEA